MHCRHEAITVQWVMNITHWTASIRPETERGSEVNECMQSMRGHTIHRTRDHMRDTMTTLTGGISDRMTADHRHLHPSGQIAKGAPS